MKSKLSLKNLKVESFVTSLDKNSQQTVVGGKLTIEASRCQDCIPETRGGTDCPPTVMRLNGCIQMAD